MRILVTGATGLIGNAIVHALHKRGQAVRALVRDLEAGAPFFPPGVNLVRGDINEPASLDEPMNGVESVFHAAGLSDRWQRREDAFDEIHREGTKHVLEAALRAGVQRVVQTSCMHVFRAAPGGIVVESDLDPEPKPGAYERSKQAAEAEAERVRAQGLEVVYVNPAPVYGPGQVNGLLNAFFMQVLNRELSFLPPGGTSVAFVKGVARAHLAALVKGKSGERYLLSDGYVSLSDLARLLLLRVGGRRPPPTSPIALARANVSFSAALARVFRSTPALTPGQLEHLSWGARVDPEKAAGALGFQPTPLEEGIEATIAFLREQRLIPPAR